MTRPLATLLTPAGRAAIATIAVEGQQAASIVQQQFISASNRQLSRLGEGQIAFGFWGDARGEEVVVCITSRGLEIHCHGGRAASRAILQSLSQLDVEIAETADGWLESQVPGKLERDAWRLLAETTTQHTAARLLAQYHGALRAELGQVVLLLRGRKRTEAVERLTSLLANARFGIHLTRPWKVVLNGPPNVGKSRAC